MIGNRRIKERFPIEGEIAFRAYKAREPAVSGTGKTINASSKGLLFETSERLEVGMRIELAMDWAAELDSGCALKFLVSGRVVRVGKGQAAVKIDRYEHRTRKRGPLSV
jgi:PilZ domain